jgi:hypothetical protein
MKLLISFQYHEFVDPNLVYSFSLYSYTWITLEVFTTLCWRAQVVD